MRAAALAALFAATFQSGTAPPAGVEILEVRPSFYVIAGPGENAPNVAVQVGEDGIVVVDSGSTTDAPRVLAAIKSISPRPIRYVINTGPDADHVGGNEVLAGAGEKLIAGGLPGGGAP